jgi:hypothetical protein
MNVVEWGNAGEVEIQGLTASKFLPQLTQDEFLLCGWYAETPGNMPDWALGTIRSRAT